jgi:hypothetical protein
MARDDITGDFNPDTSTLYTSVAASGAMLMAVASLGLVGSRTIVRGGLFKILGRLLLRGFCVSLSVLLLASVALCAAIAW